VEDRSGIRSRQEDHLIFGPRWRVLHQACYGEDEALGRLALGEAVCGDIGVYGLHPGLVDIATGLRAQSSRPGTAAGVQDLWVPISYKRVRVFGDLPARIVSWVRLARSNQRDRADQGFASFDVTIADEQGRVLVEVEELTMRRLEGTALVAERAPSAAEIELEARARGELSPGELAFQHSLSQGIVPGRGGSRVLRRVLQQGEDRSVLFASSMDLRALIAQAGRAGGRARRRRRPSSRAAAGERVRGARATTWRRRSVGLWEGLLGVNQVGVRDSFFELGGHSLIAGAASSPRSRRRTAWTIPISVLFEAPPSRAARSSSRGASVPAPAKPVAAPLARRPTRSRYTHLVPMHAGNGAIERKTAVLPGGRHVRERVEPEALSLSSSARIGPSTGCRRAGSTATRSRTSPSRTWPATTSPSCAPSSRTAPTSSAASPAAASPPYEIGHQYAPRARRWRCSCCSTRRCPRIRTVTFRDRITIHQQNIANLGPMYAVTWLRNKRDWKRSLREKEQKRQQQQASAKGHDFHSQVIEAGFERAVGAYPLRPAAARRGALPSPRLKPMHQLGPGRAINAHRRFIYHDNGWTPFVKKVAVHEVPGDHDSWSSSPTCASSPPACASPSTPPRPPPSAARRPATEASNGASHPAPRAATAPASA
jgi:hypothetical protein